MKKRAAKRKSKNPIKLAEKDLGNLKGVLEKRGVLKFPASAQVVKEFYVEGYNWKKGGWEKLGYFDAKSRDEAIEKAKRKLGKRRADFKKFITGAQRLNPMKKKATKKRAVKKGAKKTAPRKKKNFTLTTSKRDALIRKFAKATGASNTALAYRIGKRLGYTRAEIKYELDQYKKNPLFTTRKRAAAKAQKLRAKAQKLEKHSKRPTLRARAKRRAASKAHRLVSMVLGNPKGIPASDRLNRLWGKLAARFDETYPSETDVLKRATPAERKLFKKLKAVAKKEPGHSRNPQRNGGFKESVKKGTAIMAHGLVKKALGNPKKRKVTKKRRNKTVIVKPKRVLVMNKAKVKRRNGAADEAKKQRQMFAGKSGRVLNLRMPEGTPTHGLSTLGPLAVIESERLGTIKPTGGKCYYCRDLKGKLYFGTPDGQKPLWSGPAESLGPVRRVEYMAAKPHLGEPRVVQWYHDFEAPFPILKADGDGGIRQVGGGYKIKREGIVG